MIDIEQALRPLTQRAREYSTPVELIVARAQKRRTRRMVLRACVSVVALAAILATVAVTLPLHGGHDGVGTVGPNHRGRDPLSGRTLPRSGLVILDDPQGGGSQQPSSFAVTLVDDTGDVIARLGRQIIPNDVLNAPWYEHIVVSDNAVRIEHRPLPQSAGAPAGCSVTSSIAGAQVAVCGARVGDQLLGARIVVNRGHGWSTLIAKPPVAAGIANGGNWEYALTSADGRFVLAQWSGECEAPTAFLISVADRSVHAVTGQAGTGWVGAPESGMLGWAGSGEALAVLGSAGCGPSAHDTPGIYAVAPSDRSRHLLFRLRHPSNTTVLRWTTVDDTRTAASNSVVPRCPGPANTFPRLGQQVVPVSVPCDCPTAAVLPMPTAAGARSDAVHAALRWVTAARHWPPGAGRLTAVYRVGQTSQGAEFSSVFAYNVPAFCGSKVADASYGVELWNPQEHDTGQVGDVVVAYFKGGWQVWGSYHP